MNSLRQAPILTLAACVIFNIQLAEGARILGVFPIPSFSHQAMLRALMIELARRGHQLVVITPNPVNDPSLSNYTEIDVSFMYKDFQESNNFTASKENNKSPFILIRDSFNACTQTCESIMGHEKVRAMIDSKNTQEHFDLVFMEWMLTPCMVAFSHRFSAPLIGMISCPLFGTLHDGVGNPTNPSYLLENGLGHTDKQKTFFNRLETTIYYLRFRHFFYNTLLPRQDAITKRYFGPSTPYIGDLYTQVSMLFVTYLPGFHSPRPNVPAVVNVNGLHINPLKALRKDVQKFLDSSPKGAVYFSLGTSVRTDWLNTEKLAMFLEVFSELPDYNVLWKSETGPLPGQPSNVMVVNWTSQHDVLRHPMVKAFVTQGGLQSTEEAILAHVPMVGLPFFADQDLNTNLAQERGIAIQLDPNSLTKTKLLEALRRILEDKSYRENIERLSVLLQDQQNTPMERAVWWTEYVLRHKGAKHLRTAAVDMPLFTYLLLDVALFFLVVTLLVTALLWITASFIYREIKLIVLKKTKSD